MNSLPLNRFLFLAALLIVIVLDSGYFLLFTGVLKLTLPALIMIALISVALVTATTSALAIFVKNPIKQMTDAVERLAQSELSVTLQVNLDNEIGKLANF